MVAYIRDVSRDSVEGTTVEKDKTSGEEGMTITQELREGQCRGSTEEYSWV
jgi:hypothetical protein